MLRPVTSLWAFCVLALVAVSISCAEARQYASEDSTSGSVWWEWWDAADGDACEGGRDHMEWKRNSECIPTAELREGDPLRNTSVHLLGAAYDVEVSCFDPESLSTNYNPDDDSVVIQYFTSQDGSCNTVQHTILLQDPASCNGTFLENPADGIPPFSSYASEAAATRSIQGPGGNYSSFEPSLLEGVASPLYNAKLFCSRCHWMFFGEAAPPYFLQGAGIVVFLFLCILLNYSLQDKVDKWMKTLPQKICCKKKEGDERGSLVMVHTSMMTLLVSAKARPLSPAWSNLRRGEGVLGGSGLSGSTPSLGTETTGTALARADQAGSTGVGSGVALTPFRDAPLMGPGGATASLREFSPRHARSDSVGSSLFSLIRSPTVTSGAAGRQQSTLSYGVTNTPPRVASPAEAGDETMPVLPSARLPPGLARSAGAAYLRGGRAAVPPLPSLGSRGGAAPGAAQQSQHSPHHQPLAHRISKSHSEGNLEQRQQKGAAPPTPAAAAPPQPPQHARGMLEVASSSSSPREMSGDRPVSVGDLSVFQSIHRVSSIHCPAPDVVEEYAEHSAGGAALFAPSAETDDLQHTRVDNPAVSLLLEGGGRLPSPVGTPMGYTPLASRPFSSSRTENLLHAPLDDLCLSTVKMEKGKQPRKASLAEAQETGLVHPSGCSSNALTSEEEASYESFALRGLLGKFGEVLDVWEPHAGEKKVLCHFNRPTVWVKRCHVASATGEMQEERLLGRGRSVWNLKESFSPTSVADHRKQLHNPLYSSEGWGESPATPRGAGAPPEDDCFPDPSELRPHLGGSGVGSGDGTHWGPALSPISPPSTANSAPLLHTPSGSVQPDPSGGPAGHPNGTAQADPAGGVDGSHYADDPLAGATVDYLLSLPKVVRPADVTFLVEHMFKGKSEARVLRVAGQWCIVQAASANAWLSGEDVDTVAACGARCVRVADKKALKRRCDPAEWHDWWGEFELCVGTILRIESHGKDDVKCVVAFKGSATLTLPASCLIPCTQQDHDRDFLVAPQKVTHRTMMAVFVASPPPLLALKGAFLLYFFFHAVKESFEDGHGGKATHHSLWFSYQEVYFKLFNSGYPTLMADCGSVTVYFVSVFRPSLGQFVKGVGVPILSLLCISLMVSLPGILSHALPMIVLYSWLWVPFFLLVYFVMRFVKHRFEPRVPEVHPDRLYDMRYFIKHHKKYLVLSGLFHLSFRVAMELLAVIFLQTNYNYGVLLYGGKPYFETIIEEFAMRQVTCLWELGMRAISFFI